MGKRMTLGLLVLGALALGSGCHHYYGYDRYPVYAAPHHPGAYWTGAGLAAAGNVVLQSAHHQSNPGAALAAVAVGAGLQAAGAGAMHYSYTHPRPSRYYDYRYDYAPPRPRRHYHYGR